MTENINFTTQSGAIYIQMNGDTVVPFEWAGRKAQLGDISTPYGALTTTTAFDPRGGVYKDGTLIAEPAEVTTELTIKHEQHSRMRSHLIGKSFNIDKRAHVSGKDKDSPTKWDDIQRIVNARITDRKTPKTTSSGEEESLITLPISAQFDVDIYRTTYSKISLVGLATPIIDVAAAVLASSKDKGIVYAVADVTIPHPDVTLLVNHNGGEGADWEIKTLTGVTDNPVAIIGYGNFVGILFDTYILRSDTYGDAFSQVSPSGWAGMTNIFGIDQTALFAVGANGYVSRSKDGGRTWNESLQAGTVTVETLTGGHIVDERVLYSIGTNGTVLRSNDFGVSWYAITTGLTTDILSITAPDRSKLFFVDSAGLIHQSADAGETVLPQATLEGLPVATYTNATIIQLGAGVYFVTMSTGSLSYYFRNVDGASTGYWYVPNNVDALANINSAVMLNNNLLLAVGGTTTTNELVSIR